MLIPKKVKHRKCHKGRQRGHATDKIALAFGSYGLKAMGTTWVTARQIEAARRAVTHFLQKGGKLWVRIFPDKPVTAKSSEIPMGMGKGPVDHYVAVVKPGTIMLELDGIKRDEAKEAFRLASHKFSIRTKFIEKL